MLRIGLTGGIGAGKSTVAATFAECGGIVVDGDIIAREVVEPGTEGLAALVEAFGERILLPDGALNRPALAAVAFGDDEKRATLNGIVHPLVGRRRTELIDEAIRADPNPIIVEDIPLLVESQLAPLFPLVVVVHAEIETRLQRLVEHRGMPEADVRARIAAQVTEEQRRAVADVWLDNSGTAAELAEQARQLWHQRIVPFADNLQARQPADTPKQVVSADPSWPNQAQRILARLRTACGHRAVRVDHIGFTAVAGAAARDAIDVIDVQITVESIAVADELAESLFGAGYPRIEAITADIAEPDARSTVAAYDHNDDPALWQKRFHASADPGRPTGVHIRVDGRPNQQFALLFPAWLAANPTERFDDGAYRRAWAWADDTGWRP
ncbi:MAG: dephospho-CoA kinase [Mycobacterium sp.]